MSTTLYAGLGLAGAIALTAAFSQTNVAEDDAYCKLGGDYYASIVKADTGEVLRTSGIAVNERAGTCTIDAGNQLVSYKII